MLLNTFFSRFGLISLQIPPMLGLAFTVVVIVSLVGAQIFSVVVIVSSVGAQICVVAVAAAVVGWVSDLCCSSSSSSNV